MKFYAQEIADNYPVQTQIDGKWVKARPMDWQGLMKWKYRISEAWLVLTGKADVLIWYKQ